MVMEYLNGILFQKSGPANKLHTNHSYLLQISCKLSQNLPFIALSFCDPVNVNGVMCEICEGN